MSNNKNRLEPLDIVFGAACLLVILVPLSYWFNFKDQTIAAEASSWGAFGDYIGGVINPILGFFSFMALLITLDLQRKQLGKTEEQLELNRDELAETRKELARSAHAQEESKRVMGEQLKTQTLQQFDSLFFNLLNQFSSRVERIVGTDSFNKTCDLIFDCNLVKDRTGRRSLLLQNQELSSLFVLFFNLLKTIDNQLNNNKELKKNYTNILRSLLPQKMLQLLMINCQKEEFVTDFEEFRQLIEKFNLLKYIKFFESDIFKSSLLLNISTQYSSTAFGGNLNFLKIKGSLFYEDFEQWDNFYLILLKRLEKLECRKMEKEFGSEGSVVLSDFKNNASEFEFIWKRHGANYVEAYLQNVKITDFRIKDDDFFIKSMAWYRLNFINEKLRITRSTILDENIYDQYA